MNYCNRTTIYIPQRLTSVFNVTRLLNEVTLGCGGVTYTDHRGSFIMPDGTTCSEYVIAVAWWHKKDERTMDRIATIARVLIQECGETAVLVEYLRTARREGNIGTIISALLLTREDVEESTDE